MLASLLESSGPRLIITQRLLQEIESHTGTSTRLRVESPEIPLYS
jgi:hypothetical protein